ncbi:Hypothetical protein R9X50_00336400 [Acrodontium crateriforme]|uniref:ATPase inhibitor, mitochondrial n=1 Tax=Acrodontium crateriforme TaxID=150365 RepID=A0AAQ3M368_9PEZI|nr:Hypothetical protein R9X50_00336400 [Acrodontium crateriforme]
MSLARISRQLPRLASNARAFSVSTRQMAGGDTGAPRSGGAAQSDAFTKREKANEDHYVKRQEAEKLAALKKKIADHEADLAKTREEVEKLQKK